MLRSQIGSENKGYFDYVNYREEEEEAAGSTVRHRVRRNLKIEVLQVGSSFNFLSEFAEEFNHWEVESASFEPEKTLAGATGEHGAHSVEDLLRQISYFC